MHIACLGDSLTEGALGAAGVGVADPQPQNYPYFLGQILGCTTANFGKCGHNCRRFLDWYNSGEVKVANADIIILMLGTNGGMDPKEDKPGNREYAEIINRCQTQAPKAQVVLCTPPHATEDPQKVGYGAAANVAKAAEVVRRVAKERGLPVINLHRCPKFSAQTEAQYQTYDGLHFSVEGYRVLAEIIAQELQALLPKLF